MRLLLVRAYGDGSNATQLLDQPMLERSIVLGEMGDDRPTGKELDSMDRAVNEIFSAKEALENSSGVYAKYYVVLEPDES